MKYIKIWMAFSLIISCFLESLKAQNANEVTINSTVHDGKGKPLSGAVVSGNEGKTITYTDKTGQFNITVPANSVVLINAKGFKMQTLRANAIPVSIGMVTDNAAQDVHLPFSKVDRQDLPGAVSVLDPETYIDYDYNLSVEGGMNG